jgi:hypothetical protein
MSLSFLVNYILVCAELSNRFSEENFPRMKGRAGAQWASCHVLFLNDLFYLGKRMPGPRFAKSSKTRHLAGLLRVAMQCVVPISAFG